MKLSINIKCPFYPSEGRRASALPIYAPMIFILTVTVTWLGLTMANNYHQSCIWWLHPAPTSAHNGLDSLQFALVVLFLPSPWHKNLTCTCQAFKCLLLQRETTSRRHLNIFAQVSTGCTFAFGIIYTIARIVTRTCQPVTVRAGSKGCDSNLSASYHQGWQQGLWPRTASQLPSWLAARVMTWNCQRVTIEGRHG